MLTIQFFEYLNVASLSLCSSYLGSGEIPEASSVMIRLAMLAFLIGALMGLLVFTAGREPLVRIFTSDPSVTAQVGVPDTPSRQVDVPGTQNIRVFMDVGFTPATHLRRSVFLYLITY